MKTIERRLKKLETVVSQFPEPAEELDAETERLLLLREIDEFLRDLDLGDDDDADVDDAEADAEDDDFWDKFLKGAI